MSRNVIGMVLAALVLLFVSGCEPDTVPFLVYCSIRGNGTGFTQHDSSLSPYGYSKTYYVSDDLVLQLNDTIVKRNISSGGFSNLLPGNFTLTDKQFIAIDRDNDKVYFAADYAIWKIGLGGMDLLKLSPNDGSYSAPALSPCGNYLTAIKNGHIARMNLNTGTWIVLPEISSAIYAVFFSDTDEYYSFCSSPLNYVTNLALCRFSAATHDSTCIMSDVYYGIDDYVAINISTNRNHRYFAMHQPQEPILVSSWFGYPDWVHYYDTLWLFDRKTGAVSSIPNCFSYSFVMDTDKLLYSHLIYEMSDLMSLDLASGTSTMIWDGYYSPHNYSFSIMDIYPRYDGEKIYLKTWIKAQND